jgi:hypothetical protein
MTMIMKMIVMIMIIESREQLYQQDRKWGGQDCNDTLPSLVSPSNDIKLQMWEGRLSWCPPPPKLFSTFRVTNAVSTIYFYCEQKSPVYIIIKHTTRRWRLSRHSFLPLDPTGNICHLANVTFRRTEFILYECKRVTTLTTELITFWWYAIRLFHNASNTNMNINQWKSTSKIGTTTRPRRSLWGSWRTVVCLSRVHARPSPPVTSSRKRYLFKRTNQKHLEHRWGRASPLALCYQTARRYKNTGKTTRNLWIWPSEDGTDRLPQNVGKELPLLAA